jgi:sporulation protein YlmC with PRC-barrel domain
VGVVRGYVHDIVIDTNNWVINALIVTKWLRKREYALDTISKVDRTKQTVIQRDELEGVTLEEQSLAHMHGRALMKRKVFSKDGYDIGYLYDFDIDIDAAPWSVKKVLIYRKLTKRRLRENPSIILSISDKVILAKTLEELEELEG